MWTVVFGGCSEYSLDDGRKDPAEPAPDIEVSPATVRFDTMPAGCTAERSVSVTNVGDAPLNVDGSWMEGDATLSASWLTQTLDPGEGTVVTVGFYPTVDGGSSGSLVVASDDPDEPEAGSAIDGVASSTSEVLDAWVQESRPVDVLWVVDNSGSMGAEQPRVIAEIEEFFTWFETFDLDYHMGVITTDIVTSTMAGRLQGSPTFITPDTTDPLAELSEAIAVGTEDQGEESGLAAMQLALSEPLRSGENAEFLRDEAQLVMTFFSDEPEQSGVGAYEYINFLETLKADPTWISLSAIVGDRTSGCTTTCDTTTNEAQPGDAYIDVVEAFDGVFGSICTCELTDILASIGLESTLFSREFELSALPASADDIHVFVEGTETTAWTYDVDGNVIILDSPPVSGQIVEALYPTAVSCP